MLVFGGLALGTALAGSMGLLPSGIARADSEKAAAVEPVWAAAAPGRVEPKGRELNVRAPAPGLIKEVLVQLNDKVKTGDLLIRLDDEELKAKLAAAKAEAGVRAAERDDKEVKGAAHDRRKAEDSLYAAERSAFDARMDLDRLISLSRANNAEAGDLDKARAAVKSAEEKVEQDRASLKRLLAKTVFTLTREEAALAAARADVAVVSTALERTHIRSPIDAAVLDLHAKLGEMANPAAERPLLVLGDTAHLQVRAEVQERDVRNIYAGQAAIVKSDAFPNRSFDARVSVLARALGEPQLLARGQRKPTEVGVLAVILDLDDGVPLLPGMRVDVLFKEANGQKTAKSD